MANKMIKVLSGSLSESTLKLPKADFLKLTKSLHNEELEKKTILIDLWKSVNADKAIKTVINGDKAATPELPTESKES